MFFERLANLWTFSPLYAILVLIFSLLGVGGCANNAEEANARRDELRGWSEFARDNGLRFHASGTWGDAHLLGWSWNATGSHGSFTLTFDPTSTPSAAPAASPNPSPTVGGVFNSIEPEYVRIVIVRGDLETGERIGISGLFDPDLSLLTAEEYEAIPVHYLFGPPSNEMCIMDEDPPGHFHCVDNLCTLSYPPPMQPKCEMQWTPTPSGGILTCKCAIG